MRKDALGLFWEDIPEVKKKKDAPLKRQPPKHVWKEKTYLPNLESALAFIVPKYENDAELIYDVQIARDQFVFDIECYPNFVQVAFLNVRTGKILDFVESPGSQINITKLEWMLAHVCIVGFNSRGYDMPMLACILSGLSPEKCWAVTHDIIQNETPWREAIKRWKVRYKEKCGHIDHIDLIEVAPLFASLKVYNGRLHGELMQDLPFEPGTYLTFEQGAITRLYCVNDLRATLRLYMEIKEQIDLRVDMGERYGTDLRSKSDAQIAETVIAHEIEKETGSRPVPPEIPVGTAYRYDVPHFIAFRTPLMQKCLEIVRNAYFVVGAHGSIEMPAELAKLQLAIGDAVYTMGIGGLHSTEKSKSYLTGNGWKLYDRDVKSFYPSIMVLLCLFPEGLGERFLKIFSRILKERIEAKDLAAAFKKAGDKVKQRIYQVIAAVLKIVANGAYGKLGSKYSVLYSPRLLTQVTITGQLSLLMLIEALELEGIRVVSGNTDGIVSYVHDSQRHMFLGIVDQWEKWTKFQTEEVEYKALYSRDVNNYIALKPDGKFKSKGSYFDPWGQRAAGEEISDECLRKNPQNQICIEAIVKLLRDGIPVKDTIRSCTDVTRFITVRTVTGGAVKVWDEKTIANFPDKASYLQYLGWYYIDGVCGWNRDDLPDEYLASNVHIDEDKAIKISSAYGLLSSQGGTEYLGKAIRWYYGEGAIGEIVAAKSGNKVPKTDGAVPLMKLPETLPTDINYEWYEKETEKMLEWIGYA